MENELLASGQTQNAFVTHAMMMIVVFEFAINRKPHNFLIPEIIAELSIWFEY